MEASALPQNRGRKRGRAGPSSLSPGATRARPCRCHGGRQPGSPRGPPCTCRARCQEGCQSPAGPLGGPSAAREGILFLLELLGARCHPPPGFPSASGTVPGPGAEGPVPSSHSASAARPAGHLPVVPPVPAARPGATCWLPLFPKCVGVGEPRDLPLADFYSSL